MIASPDPERIAQAAALLRQGALVGMPTETVYGLAGHALDEAACRAIFRVKGRPFFDPLIVHVNSLAMARTLTTEWPAHAETLAQAFWPGPLTMILPRAACVPDLVTAGLGTVALRWSAHPVAQALITACGLPLAAPSANPFGYLSPTTAEHVEEQLGAAIPLTLDGGPCAKGVESTIIDLSVSPPRILRPGSITAAQLHAVLGLPVGRGQAVLDKPVAPGQLLSHYAPRTPLRLLPPDAPLPAAGTTGPYGLLAWSRAEAAQAPCACEAVEILSPSGQLEEAAQALFAALHRLDDAGLKLIIVREIPEDGLGAALMDRLRKAARAH